MTKEEILEALDRGESPVLLRKGLFVIGTFQGTAGSSDHEIPVLFVDGLRSSLQPSNNRDKDNG